MPFQSEAQRKFMYAAHPSIAKRWEALTPKGKLPEHSSSEESPNPKIARLPRRSGPRRDFSSLTPGQYARHPGKGSEKDSMQEGPVAAHFPDGRAEKMSIKEESRSAPARRDLLAAARKRT